MGLGASKAAASPLYAVPITGSSSAGQDSPSSLTEAEEKLNSSEYESSPIFRAANFQNELVSNLEDPVLSSWAFFDRSSSENPNLPCIGYRRMSTSGHLTNYDWRTYKEVKLSALSFGSGLVAADMVSEVVTPEEEYLPAQKMRMIGIFTVNCFEWFLTELACNAYALTLVPIYETLGPQAIAYTFAQSQLSVCVSSVDSAGQLLQVVKQFADARETLKHVILVDTRRPVDGESIDVVYWQEKFDSFGVTIHDFKDICASGKNNLREPSPASLEAVNTLCYTSGTSGDPKAVILTHRNIVSNVAAAMRGPTRAGGPFSVGANDVHISYLPLAHVFERLVCNVVLAGGGAIGIYSGDTTKLLDDIKTLQPTVFISVPRLFNRINDRVTMSVKSKGMVSQYLFNRSLTTKIQRFRDKSILTHRLWDPLVFDNVRALMGKRLRGMISGGAPLDHTVQDKMKCLFSCPLMEGYGMSETFGPALLAHPLDPVSGHVGGPFPSVEFKVVTVPDSQYSKFGKIWKGELCLRGPSITVGYFKNAEETRQSIDGDGWLHTGDIVEIMPGSNAVRIFDRKKNIFKLAQGEYVAPEKLEGVYLQCPLVAQIYVYGEPSQAQLLGVIVPEEDAVKSWAKNKNVIYTNLADVCRMPSFIASVKIELEDQRLRAGLKGFERLAATHILTEPFTVENQQLTPTMKLRRNELNKVFKTTFEEMYRSLAPKDKSL